MDGLKNFATCGLHIVVTITGVRNPRIMGICVNRSSLPLQPELPAFHVTTIVVVPCGTKFHELGSAVVRETALQPFIEAVRKRIEVQFGSEIRTLEFGCRKL